MIKVKPWHGKWCSRREANRMNDFLATLQVPDRTALEKEAKEYESLMLARREKAISKGEKW